MMRAWLSCMLLLGLVLGGMANDGLPPGGGNPVDPPGDTVDPSDPRDIPPGSRFVETDMTPLNDEVPLEGGVLSGFYDMRSRLDEVRPNMAIWSLIELPDGRLIGPLSVTDFTLQPRMTLEHVPLSQVVPGHAPGGTYTYFLCIGTYPEPESVDAWNFEKAGDPLLNGERFVFDPADWPSYGTPHILDLPHSNSQRTPLSRMELAPPAPNPFNHSSVAVLTLPARMQVQVDLVDMTGRVARRLVEGPVQAGRNEIAVDARGLPSGTYVLSVRGEYGMHQARRITLVK